MKRIVALLLTLMLGVILLFSLASCGECEHTYGEWVVDREATESEVGERHRECTKCGDKITEEIPKLAHTHTYAEAWSYDDTYHFHASTCGHASEVSGKAAHTYGDWIIDREATEDAVGAKHRVCTVCHKVENVEIPELSHTHTYAEAWSYDDSYHWHDSTCGHDPIGKAAHTYGDWIIDREATEDTAGTKHRVCTVCNKIGNAEIEKLPHTHKYASTWSYDDTYHWHASTCGHTDAVSDKERHDFGESGICKCGVKGESISVKVYIDGTLTDTLHTGLAYGFRITPPEKPEDITANSNSEKYFYAWFTDPNFQTPLLDTTEFRADGAIYAKWITVYSNGFRYTVSEGKATIVSLSVTSTATTTLVIPAYINGFPVTTIGKDAFANNTFIRTLILCGGIQNIGVGAFSGCNSMTHVELPKSLTTIGEKAFQGCSTLPDISILENVTSIGNHAFSGCSNLKYTMYDNAYYLGNHDNPYYVLMMPVSKESASVQIHENTAIIYLSAFSDCTELTSITIPNSVKIIEDSAFIGCDKLIEVVNLSSLNITVGSEDYGYIGYYAKHIITDEKDSCLTTDGNGYIFYDDGSNVYLVGYTGTGTELVLPSASPNGKTYEIYKYAFYECSKLTNVMISNSITGIGASAFRGCTGLTHIMIPNSVTSIGVSAFSGCSSLESIILPFVGESRKSASDMYQYPFGYIFGTSSYTGGVATEQYYHGSSTSSTPNSTYYIPQSLKSVTITGGNILYGAFYNCKSLTSITIPDSVTSIGQFAFYGCTGLTNIVIPDSVTSIGSHALLGCTGLTSITIPFVGATKNGTDNTHFGYIFGAYSYSDNKYYVPSSLKTVVITEGTSIDNSAFKSCTGLTSITIPDSVTSIGQSAFYGCTGLTNIVIPDSVTSIDSYAFCDCTGLSNIEIPDSVTSIGRYAFYGCSSLTSITIPNGVTSISEGTFWGCSSLESITLPFVGGSQKSASDTYQDPFGYIFGTFSYTGGVATEQYYYGSSTSNTTYSTYYIPQSLKSVTITGGNILYGAFSSCTGLTSITIPDNVTSISYGAFSSCTGLTSITIPDSVRNIGSRAFYKCTNLKTVTFAENSRCSNIDYSAFEGCTGLTSITIPDNVTSISYGAFSSCTGLTSITIPDSVRNIGNRAFYKCTNLKTVTFAENSRCSSIGSSAFEGCTGLTSITIPDSVTYIGTRVFENCEKVKILFDGTQEEWEKIEKASDWAGNSTYTVTYLK